MAGLFGNLYGNQNNNQNLLYGMSYGNQQQMNGYAPQVQIDPTTGATISAVNPNMLGQIGQLGQMNKQGGFLNPQTSPWQNFSYVMDGIGALGGLWGAIQQNKLAKQQFQFTKDAYNTNLRNSVQSYNTTLEDRVRARYAMEGRDDQVDSYLEQNRLRA